MAGERRVSFPIGGLNGIRGGVDHPAYNQTEERMADFMIITDSCDTTCERLVEALERFGMRPENSALVCPEGLDGGEEFDRAVRFEPPLSQWRHADVVDVINTEIRPRTIVILVEAPALRPAGNDIMSFVYFIRGVEEIHYLTSDGVVTDISADVLARMRQTRNWTDSGQGFYVRQYESYEDYVRIQCSKYMNDEEKIRQDTERLLYPRFKARFETVAPLLPQGASVMCIGARSGWEVKAYRDLGHNGIGIDLYPGNDNPYVVYGDAHSLEWPDGLFDLVYCNVIDHLPYLDRFLGEAKRISRRDGLCFFEFGRGMRAEQCEALAWESADALIDYLKAACGKVEVLQDKFGVVQFVARLHP
jgi:hypothetical protein